MPVQTVIKVRRDTAADWISTNPVLASGEMGLETDTDLFKFGNGTATWTALAYSSSSRTTQIAKNDTGGSVTKGQVVYISGANGANALFLLADADSEATSSKTVGLLAQGLATNGIGAIVTEGLLSGVNTGTATAGQSVWLSGTAGGFVFGAPPAKPAHSVYLGVVTRAHATEGEILVKVQNGYELNELHDVNAGSPADNNVIAWDSASSMWTNQTASQAGLATASDLAAKAPLASPTFTGTVTATTFSGALSGNASTATTATNASILTTTNQGKTGGQALAAPANPAAWAALPIGYSAMFNSNRSAYGAPNDNYGYFIKIANRDSAGGWSGLWIDYSTGALYSGTTATDTAYATWVQTGGKMEYTVKITGTQSWTAPAGVTKVEVILCGGGGGGGGANTGTSPGSGGGGSVDYGVLTVSPGTGYTVTIGAGGGVTSQAAGTAGSASSFGALLTAAGGPGGGFNTSTAGSALGGGSGPGMNGAPGFGGFGGGGGGGYYPLNQGYVLPGGGASGGGRGGSSGALGTAAVANTGSGGGGSGAGGALAGSAGGSGVCIIKYWA